MAGAKSLEGLTVYEFGHSVAAPFAGLILSDLGAEVLKIENPGKGDHARGWGPPFWDGAATSFHALNRGKKSLAVDLADPAAAAALRARIIQTGGVVIQNLRAGVIERYGLGAAALLAEQPALIYCNIGAFGDAGPLLDKPGYDPLMQAFAGLMSVTGEGGGRPPVRSGVSVVDMGAGMWVTIGILTALLDKVHSGRGGVISTSLYETALTWMTLPLAKFQACGEVVPPFGSGVAEIVPYQCFPTQDGWLMIAAGNDGLFRKLCTALALPGLAEDPRYATNAGRVVHRDSLLPVIEAATGRERLEALVTRLDELRVPNAPLQDIGEVSRHPQTRALDMIQAGPGGALPVPALPLRFDGVRPASRWPTPALGEHNAILTTPGS